MVVSPSIRRNDGIRHEYYIKLRTTDDIPDTIQFWMGYVAREMLVLGVYLRAAAVMLQVPGAAKYKLVCYDKDDDPQDRLEDEDRDTVFNVLAHCLAEVGADAKLIEQVPGGTSYEKEKLPGDWLEYLETEAKKENVLLNIIAECLDELMVRPGIEEIHDKPRVTWWQDLWGKIEND